MSKKFSFNYLYFGFLFLLLSLLHFLSLPMTKAGLLFFGESLCQTLIGIFILIAISYWIEKKCPFLYKSWVTLLFFLPLIYLIDFCLLALMDVPLSYEVNIFLDQGIGKFFVALRAANINTPILLLIAATLFALPFTALWLDRLTKTFLQQRPIYLSFSFLLKSSAFFGMLLLAFDFSIYHTLSLSCQDRYQRRLPWGTTLFSPHPLSSIAFSSQLKRLRQSENIPTLKPRENLPNIYLFVVESLRKDAITEETAARLFSFQKENISLPITFASANFSPISWFSIFHGLFPIYWRETMENKGSVCLSLLKQLGYKIHLFSSAELEYFHMDESIFGPKHQLADEYCAMPQNMEVCERDAKVISLLQNALNQKENAQGNCFIVFLDSTHSEYSWPKNFPSHFAPITTTIPYLFLLQSHALLPHVKNRYFNAIRYVDSLFGSFLDTLKEKQLQDSSIVIFTADHGEEFFEEGALFHGTHLNNPQTRIPIFYQFPKSDCKVQTKMTSHIDIFPTLLHFLTQDASLADLFDGVSLFASHRWPYILTVHQNGGKTPYVLSLLNQKGRMIGRLDKNIFQSKEFSVISMKNSKDEEIEENDPAFGELANEFTNAFDPFFRKR
jgi:hypothetical protein